MNNDNLVTNRMKEHAAATDFGKTIVKLLAENNFTIRQSKTALRTAEKLLEEVKFHQSSN